MRKNPFNPVLWAAYGNELIEKGCTICEYYSISELFGKKIEICAKGRYWVGNTNIPNCKWGKIRNG
jgi:hypothetical protein